MPDSGVNGRRMSEGMKRRIARRFRAKTDEMHREKEAAKPSSFLDDAGSIVKGLNGLVKRGKAIIALLAFLAVIAASIFAAGAIEGRIDIIEKRVETMEKVMVSVKDDVTYLKASGEATERMVEVIFRHATGMDPKIHPKVKHPDKE